MTTALASNPQKRVDREVRRSKPQSAKVFVGREDAAEMLSVCARTIDNAIRSGRLEAFKIGKRVVIHENTLMKFAMRLPVRPQRCGFRSRALEGEI